MRNPIKATCDRIGIGCNVLCERCGIYWAHTSASVCERCKRLEYLQRKYKLTDRPRKPGND